MNALLSLSLIFVVIAMIEAINPKKDYCKGQEYVPVGSVYPHLHCDKDFLVYSVSKNNHDDLIRGSEVSCARVSKALDKINDLPNTQGKADMKSVVTAVQKDWCVKKAVKSVIVDEEVLAKEEAEKEVKAEM
eukprot:gene7687-8302_t